MRPVGHSHEVGTAQQRVHEIRRGQGVTPLIGVCRSIGRLLIFPDAPFIDGNLERFLAHGETIPFLPCGHGVLTVFLHQLVELAQFALHGVNLVEDGIGFAAIGAHITVERDVVDGTVEPLHHGLVPLRETALTVGNEFDGRVGEFHQFDEMPHIRHVFLRILVAAGIGLGSLLVTQCPVFHVERFGIAVRTAQVGIVGILRAVAVFHPVGSLVGRARGNVHHEHRFTADGTTVFDELAGAELEGVDATPDEVLARTALVFWTHAIHPVEGLHERATRETYHRGCQFLRLFEHILSDAVSIRQRRTSIIDTALDVAPHIFNELSEEIGRGLA